MRLLQEILSGINRLDQEDDDTLLPDDEGISDQEGDEGDDSEQDIDQDPEDDQQLDQVADKATENPDRQGVIRAVKGAHLVYKRETEDGTYEELWVFNGGDTVSKNLSVRKAILAGTDIPTNKTTSEDGKQKYELWTAGNAEILHVTGLPN